MHMGVDTVGQDHETGGVDFFGACGQLGGQCGDDAAQHTNVGGEFIGGGHHRAAADHQIILRAHAAALFLVISVSAWHNRRRNPRGPRRF